MTKGIFMSYSRRELGFVDDVVAKLEEKNYKVWLDYRVLIPGKPWAPQIEKGLNESDTVLLVVSKASIASEYVALEWRHFLETNKRVILLIFEAVKLPQELEKYEWVDFRKSFKRGLKELFSQLEHPIVEKHKPPKWGFKAPAVVWWAFWISCITAGLSLPLLWSLFIPWILVPLPIKILRRSFNFTQVQAALILAPLLATFSLQIAPSDDDFVILNVLTLFFGVILLALLRSAGMQRWGKPEATRPKYANPLQVDSISPTPVSFYLDYAFQDRAAADDLGAALKQHGHCQVDDIHAAKAVFVIISRFKSDTEADPERQEVYPVMLQYNDKIDPKLTRIQWIDFRPGVRKLNVIAKLLDNPTDMLKGLALRPVSSQTVFSPTISTVYYLLLLLTAFLTGGLLVEASFAMTKATKLVLFVTVPIFIACYWGVTFSMLKGLTTRTGWFMSFRRLFQGFAVIAIPLTIQSLLMYSLVSDPGQMIITIFLVAGIYLINMIILALLARWSRRDIERWFPAEPVNV